LPGEPAMGRRSHGVWVHACGKCAGQSGIQTKRDNGNTGNIYKNGVYKYREIAKKRGDSKCERCGDIIPDGHSCFGRLTHCVKVHACKKCVSALVQECPGNKKQATNKHGLGKIGTRSIPKYGPG